MRPTAPNRKLRVYSFDPSIANSLETNEINEVTLSLPWDLGDDPDITCDFIGPVGEYLEVIDFDPSLEAFYKPVNLNDPNILTNHGLSPSESNPQFHQQMVYAVVMQTIGHFENALGRVVLWSPRWDNGEYKFVRKLRIYPHALREANAYYTPNKKALLFGYFINNFQDATNVPGTYVYTCLSYDIIAHEAVHAILDGIHPRFNEASNIDVHAFHEAFADIVSVFQHFTYEEVLYHQIAKTRGNLESQNLLGQLAQQFGKATGRSSALRDGIGNEVEIKDALGNVIETKWEKKKADPTLLDKLKEPHERGTILFAAVFDSFLRIYKRRISDLLRIATQGSGILPDGELNPDLVHRLSKEASKSAKHVLYMCIRALDYCPPVDISFGDYLRAIITADNDLNPDDDNNYRLAFLESFRAWGIYPDNLKTVSIETLIWPSGNELFGNVTYRNKPMTKTISKHFSELNESFEKYLYESKIQKLNYQSQDQNQEIGSRENVYNNNKFAAGLIHRWLHNEGKLIGKAMGLFPDCTNFQSVYLDRSGVLPRTEVHSVRTTLRRGVRGKLMEELLIEITQRRKAFLDPEIQDQVDSGKRKAKKSDEFLIFRRGCTILVDPKTMKVNRFIKTKGGITSNVELNKFLSFKTQQSESRNANDLMGSAINSQLSENEETFANLHRMI